MSGINRYYYTEKVRRGKPIASESTIKDVLAVVCKRYHIDYNPDEKAIITLWQRNTGELITKFTTKIYVYKNVLYVYVNNATIRAELMMVRQAMTNKINNELSKQAIKSIVIK